MFLKQSDLQLWNSGSVSMETMAIGGGMWVYGLAQDRDGWRTLVSAVMKLRVP